MRHISAKANFCCHHSHQAKPLAKPESDQVHGHQSSGPQNQMENASPEQKDTYRALFQHSVSARENAHAPNSNFKVGAAIQTRDGKVYHGSNNELTVNADHAEQMAVNAALLDGQNPKDLVAVAIIGARGELKPKHLEDRTAACGNCRQALYELNPHMVVVGADNDDVQAYLLRDELPGAYHRERTLPSPPEARAHKNPLVNAAVEARSKAYVPRSQYPVGAAVLTDKGIFRGTQAEVSSFPSLAARMALGAALAGGATIFEKLAIVGGTDPERLERPEHISFDSLQALQSLNPDAQLVLPGKDGQMKEYQLAQVLPTPKFAD